jgi:branched-chain amino acid transport system substrate-binding protein
MRAAVADFPYAQAGVLPLALDDSGQPQRAAQKMLADGRVAAVVGPLSPATAAAVAPILDQGDVSWLAPYSLAGEQWAGGLVAAGAALAVQQGAQRLVLAGWTPGWPELDAAAWSKAAGLNVRLLDDPAGVRSDEAVFWLGSAEGAAAYLAQLRVAQPQAIFILGPAGEDPVFAERVLAVPDVRKVSQNLPQPSLLQNTYWTAWTDGGYNGWTVRHATNSPNAYLVYRTTLAALAAASGAPWEPMPSSWTVQVFRYDAQGAWFPLYP